MLGCIALGSGIGLVAAIILLVTIYYLRKRIRGRSNAFPVREIASLGTLLALLTGQTWARAKWLPIADPLCGQAYHLALVGLLFLICYSSLRGLIRDCAMSDATRRRR
jgi:hypothetical protein